MPRGAYFDVQHLGVTATATFSVAPRTFCSACLEPVPVIQVVRAPWRGFLEPRIGPINVSRVRLLDFGASPVALVTWGVGRGWPIGLIGPFAHLRYPGGCAGPPDIPDVGAPVVVRAILQDGTLGPAWYIDEDLQIAPKPEIEDGRYQLFNADGSPRWGKDFPRP